MEPMVLPDVEQHPKPGPWHDAIARMQASGASGVHPPSDEAHRPGGIRRAGAGHAR